MGYQEKAVRWRAAYDFGRKRGGLDEREAGMFASAVLAATNPNVPLLPWELAEALVDWRYNGSTIERL